MGPNNNKHNQWCVQFATSLLSIFIIEALLLSSEGISKNSLSTHYIMHKMVSNASVWLAHQCLHKPAKTHCVTVNLKFVIDRETSWVPLFFSLCNLKRKRERNRNCQDKTASNYNLVKYSPSGNNMLSMNKLHINFNQHYFHTKSLIIFIKCRMTCQPLCLHPTIC